MELNLLTIVIGALLLIFIGLILVYASLYKKCPSDKILVIYGNTGAEKSAKCIHGGGTVVIPIIQGYQYLDLTPISIDVDLRGALSKQNIRVDVPSRFTVGISPEEGIMQNAAERLLGLKMDSIRNLAYDIIVGQMRLVIATMDIEEINTDRDKFVENVFKNVGIELRKIGLTLINVNVTDIQDDSGYIDALGKEAAAKAINDARQSVAEKNRDGSVGEANAIQEQRTKVAELNAKAKIGEAEADKTERIQIASANADAKIGEKTAEQKERIQTAEAVALAKIGEADAESIERIKTSDANAKAITGENEAKVIIAASDALRRQREAEAKSRAVASENIQNAKALEESYEAEKRAEIARAQREKATQEANIIIDAEISKRKVEIDAEAEAEKERRIAKGQADAIFLKQEAEARGIYEVLSKQAEGFDKIVKSSGGNAREAVLLMIADKLPELVKTQVEAIKNIKIDKVTVWEGGNNSPEDGNSTSKFVSGLYKSVPPLSDLFNMAGMELPSYLGSKIKNENEDDKDSIEIQ